MIFTRYKDIYEEKNDIAKRNQYIELCQKCYIYCLNLLKNRTTLDLLYTLNNYANILKEQVFWAILFSLRSIEPIQIVSVLL